MISIFYEAYVCFVLVFYLTETKKSWKIQNVLVVALAVKMEIVKAAAAKTAQAQTVERFKISFNRSTFRYRIY